MCVLCAQWNWLDFLHSRQQKRKKNRKKTKKKRINSFRSIAGWLQRQIQFHAVATIWLLFLNVNIFLSPAQWHVLTAIHSRRSVSSSSSGNWLVLDSKSSSRGFVHLFFFTACRFHFINKNWMYGCALMCTVCSVVVLCVCSIHQSHDHGCTTNSTTTKYQCVHFTTNLKEEISRSQRMIARKQLVMIRR